MTATHSSNCLKLTTPVAPCTCGARKAMTVVLGHARNPDIAGGYWQEPVDSGRKQKVEVASLAKASEVCRAFIERNGLGGGNWTGGEVRAGGKLVGRVAYNGRVYSGTWGHPGTVCLFPAQEQTA